MIWAYIPPPPFRDLFQIGPLSIHVYSLTMVLAIIVALIWSSRRVVAAGGDLDAFESIGLVAVVCGVVGARAYHVITEHARYFGPGMNPWDIFKVWNGGLGIIGAIAGGAIGLWAMCRWKGISTADVMDCIAPTLFIAQAIGRVGNYFNQEAFGKPTTLPWALEVDAAYRPSGFAQYATFHPTFLYEGIWNIIGCLVLLWIIRRFAWQHGKAITFYVLWYAFGRFFIELIRIDPVSTIFGVRINNWTDGIVFIVALGVMIFLMRRFPDHVEAPLAGMAQKWAAKRETPAEESVEAVDNTKKSVVAPQKTTDTPGATPEDEVTPDDDPPVDDAPKTG